MAVDTQKRKFIRELEWFLKPLSEATLPILKLIVHRDEVLWGKMWFYKSEIFEQLFFWRYVIAISMENVLKIKIVYICTILNLLMLILPSF